MRTRPSVSWLSGLPLFLAIGVAPSDASEPEVAFVVKDGWVEFVLRQDGRPVADALIQVVDEKGTNFAQGVTGEEGQASCPLPRGSSFVVEFKTGNRTADPIRFFKIEESVEPARVLLSYGLRPCCRFLSRKEATTDPTESELAAPPTSPRTYRLLLLTAAVGFAIVAAVLFLVSRQSASSPSTTP